MEPYEIREQADNLYRHCLRQDDVGETLIEDSFNHKRSQLQYTNYLVAASMAALAGAVRELTELLEARKPNADAE
jgi:hypothetical protein